MKTFLQNQIKQHLFFPALRLTALLLGFFLFSVSYSAQATCGSLTIEAVVTSDYNGQDVSCADLSDGTICVNVISGSGSYNYIWVGGPSGPAANCYGGVDAGTYTVIVQDLISGEICNDDVIVNEPAPQIVFSFTLTDPSCNTNCDGTGTAIVIGGTSPVDYLWGSGETGFSANNLCVGLNTLNVTDANGCSFDTTFTISTPTVIYPNVTVADVSCFGDCDGTTESFPSGGNGAPYQFSWVNNATSSVVSTASIANGLCEGSYTVTVSDVNSCNDDTVVVVNSPTLIAVSVDNSTDATCSNTCDGATTVTVTGGTLPYSSIEWFQGTIGAGAPTAVTGLTINSLCHSTDYYVTVTDANGCVQNLQIPQVSAPPPINISTIITNVDCNGNGNGSVDAIPTGGTGSLTPFWTIITPGGGLIPASEDQNNLDGGVYQLLITDDNGCTEDVTVTITEPTDLTGAITAQTDVDCNGNSTGSVTVEADAGTGTSPYLYSTDGGATTQASGTFSGLAEGSYTVTIVDDNGCTENIPVTITEPLDLTGAITAQTNVDCNGNSTGEVTVEANAGTGTSPYLYSIDGGATQVSGTFSGLAEGAYIVTILDDNGCTEDVPVTITEPTELTGAITAQTNVDCNGNSTGEVTVAADAGTGTSPYLYSIDGGATQVSGTFSGLAEGAYTVTIVDDNGCTEDVPVTITEPTDLTGAITAQTNVDCNGNSTGEVIVEADAGTGTAPYLYSIDGGATQVSGTFSGLTEGAYTVTILDDNGCTEDVPVTITEPTDLTGAITAQTDLGCNGNTTGSVTVAADAGTGTAPYLYSIDGGATQVSGTFSGLAEGAYIVTILDDNGCTEDVPVTITEPTELTGAITAQTNVDCNGNSTGEVTVEADAGTGTSPYLYSTDGGVTTQVSGTFGGLSEGSYTVTIVDDNGCTEDVPVTISEPADLTGAITAQTNVDCNGNSTGEVTVAADAGTGTSPYLYSIDGGATQVSGTFSGLAEGAYTVTIVDDNGCTEDVPVTITEPTDLTGAITAQTNVDCNGNSTGEVTVAADAGTGTAPYLYSIDGGATQVSGNIFWSCRRFLHRYNC